MKQVVLQDAKSKFSFISLQLKFLRTHKLFVFSVLIPTFLSFVYFAFIASDIYISEAQYVIRSSKQEQPTGLGMLFGQSFSSGNNDSYSVAAYMLSRDALAVLNKDNHYRQLFTRPEIDVFGRFGYLHWDESFEALHRYYNKYVNIYYDSVSSISTLKVSAYTAVDAVEINQKLLQMAEKHINFLNDRARHDLVRYAKEELLTAEKAAAEATVALTNYRNHSREFSASEFERLSVEKGFTLESLKVRRAAFESAVADAMRQILYLERVVQPNLPDYPLEPRRVKGIFSVFILGLILWGILSMLVSGVKEHHD